MVWAVSDNDLDKIATDAIFYWLYATGIEAGKVAGMVALTVNLINKWICRNILLLWFW